MLIEFNSVLNENQGVARTNRWEASFSPPPHSLMDSWRNISKMTTLMASTAIIPGKQYQTDERITAKRQSNKLPYFFTLDEFTMSFKLTNTFKIKKFFDDWLRIPVSDETYLLRYKKDYITDIEVKQLNIRDEPIHIIKILDAYPSSISAIELNSENDDTHTLDVTFDYDDIEIINATVDSKQPIRNPSENSSSFIRKPNTTTQQPFDFLSSPF